MDHFTVTYEGKLRSADRDGVEIRTRVWRGDEYFQFFTTVVDGFYLQAVARPNQNPRFWPAVARMVALGAETVIRSGSQVPLPDPTVGYRVDWDPHALRIAFESLPTDQELTEGAVLHEFDY